MKESRSKMSWQPCQGPKYYYLANGYWHTPTTKLCAMRDTLEHDTSLPAGGVLLQPITMPWLTRDTILFIGLRNISTAIQKTLILDTYLSVDFCHPHHLKPLQPSISMTSQCTPHPSSSSSYQLLSAFLTSSADRASCLSNTTHPHCWEEVIMPSNWPLPILALLHFSYKSRCWTDKRLVGGLGSGSGWCLIGLTLTGDSIVESKVLGMALVQGSRWGRLSQEVLTVG